MPEGDTIHRTANRLGAVLVDRPLTTLRAPRLVRSMPQPGTRVTLVQARGKHLLVWFDQDDLVLHTHMRMTGAWHIYRSGARWRRAPRRMRVVLADTEVQAVCFDAPIVELLGRREVERHPVLSRLGPDLVVDEGCAAVAVQRMAMFGVAHRTVAEVLLDQRIAAGIGNVYANEVAFLADVDPRTPASRVPREVFATMYGEVARLLRSNLVVPQRTTVANAQPGTLWVYGRTGRPCRRCGATIRDGRVGVQARVVHWCPTCQAAAVVDEDVAALR